MADDYEERSHGVLADVVVHEPRGCVVEDLEVADEDGVPVFESIVHLLGGIAQQGGFMFGNLYKVGILMPRVYGPVPPGVSRFDETVRDFRALRSDEDLSAVLRAWLAPKFVKERRQSERVQALQQIFRILEQKAEVLSPQSNRRKAAADTGALFGGASATAINNNGPVIGGPGPARTPGPPPQRAGRARRVSLSSVGSDTDDIEKAVASMRVNGDPTAAEDVLSAYDDECAMHGLWELARSKKNLKYILRAGDGAMLATLIGILQGVSRSFESDLARNLGAALWALALHDEPRRLLAQSDLAAKLFLILHQRNMFNTPNAPESHVFALGALRVLMEHPRNHRLLLEAPADLGIDLPDFVASIMLQTHERVVWEHASSVLLRCIARDERAIYQFLNEYPLLGGDPVKVVKQVTAPLQEITCLPVSNRKANAADADNTAIAARTSTLVMGSGARLAMAVLLYKLARHSKQGRLVLLLVEQTALNHPIHSLLRWALHAMLANIEIQHERTAVATRAAPPVSTVGVATSERRDSNDSLSFGQAEDDDDLAADVLGEATPTPASPSLRSPGATIPCSDPAVLFDALTSLLMSHQTDRSLPASPDLDCEDNLVFNQSEWSMPCGRAHDITLLYAATALWGICKCVSEGGSASPVEASSSAPGAETEASHAAEVFVDMGDFSVSTLSSVWNPAPPGFDESGSADLLEEKTSASLLGLILTSRQAGDVARPAVEICAMSALNALANAQEAETRARLLRIPLRQSASSAEALVKKVRNDRASEFGSHHAAVLTECMVGSADLNIVHHKLRLQLLAETVRNAASIAYGLSALCGLLEACIHYEIPSSVAFPTLKVRDVLARTMPGNLPCAQPGAAQSAELQEQNRRREGIVRHLACAATMLLAMDPAHWPLEDMPRLKEALLTEPQPTGANAVFLSLAVWGLGLDESRRLACLNEGFLGVLLGFCHNAMEIIDIYRRAMKAALRNKAEIDRLVSEAKKVLREKELPNIDASTAEERAQNLSRVREHLNVLNAALAAVWQLLVNRPFFKAISISETKTAALFANLDCIKEERKRIKEVREDLFAFLLRLLRAICVGTQDSSYGAFGFFVTDHCDIVDAIAHKALSVLWILASLRISDRLLCVEPFVQVLLDVAYNENVSAENRILVAKMLCYLDRLPAMSETSTTVGIRFSRLAGETYLSALVVHMLGSSQSAIHSAAARLLGQLRSTTVGQALVRDNGGIDLLLKLTEQDDNEAAVHNALRGLRHVSLDPKSQVYLCRKGLYRLLEMAWTSPHLHHRRILAQILRQLSENADNKTLIYKAELRSRHMLGWRGHKVPEVRAGVDAEGDARSSGDHDKLFKHDKNGKKAAFLDWLEEVKKDDDSDEIFDADARGRTKQGNRRRGARPSNPRRKSSGASSRQLPSLEDIYVGDDEETEPEADDEGDGMRRTLSSFLLEFRQELCEVEAGGAAVKHAEGAHNDKSGRPALKVVVPRITSPARGPAAARTASEVDSGIPTSAGEALHAQRPGESSLSPQRPASRPPAAHRSSRMLAPTSPRARRFVEVKSPVESPLWGLRDDIPGALDSSSPKRSRASRSASPRKSAARPRAPAKPERVTMHCAESPFDAETHRAVAVKLGKNLKKPTRGLWASRDLQSNMGKERWEPNVSEVTMRSPREIELELEFVRTGKLPGDAAPAGGQGLHETGGQHGLASGGARVDEDASTMPDPTKYQPRRVSEIRVKMDSSRPYSQFVFNRGGDPYSNLRAVEVDTDTFSGSETSLSSDEYHSDSSVGEAPSKQTEARTATKLAKKKRRALKRQYRRELQRRIESMTTPKRVSLSKFPHKEGARVYADIPSYELPNGERVFLYLSGGPLFGKDKMEDVDPPEMPPASVSGLGFEDGRFPRTTRIVSNEKCLAGSLLHAPLPTAFVASPKPQAHSLAPFQGRQPLTRVAWTRGGMVLDEQVPMLTVGLEDGQVQADSASDPGEEDEDPWNLENSIFAQRCQHFGSFFNAQDVRAAAFEKDWQLCEQKRTFRKLVSRYEGVIEDLKALLVEHYDVVCDSFRYFSATDQIGNIFTLQMLEFTELCEHADIKETAADSLIQEGHCNTIFIQVTKNPIEDWDPVQKSFEAECGVLSLKRGSSMMRYQYLEALVRVAEAKFVKSGKAGDVSVGVHSLIQNMREAPLMGPILGGPDRFRAEVLYREDVDNLLRANLPKFKHLFSQYAGESENSKRGGGARGRRLAFVEWQEFLAEAGLFNPLFTLRECNMIFRNSTLDLIDEVRNWRELVALGFLDFLEALGRLACHMIIPNQEQLEEVGADTIVEYYKIMESTGLWTVVHEGEHADLSAMPLAKRLQQLLMILNNVQERTNRLALESKLWLANAMTNTERQLEVEAMRKVKKRVVGSIAGMGGSGSSLAQQSVTRHDVRAPTPQSAVGGRGAARPSAEPTSPKSPKSPTSAVTAASAEEAEDESADPESSLSQALRAVEDGIPMDRFEAHVAATLHDVWRENRGREEDGTFSPRIKVIKDVEYDIANLAFKDLPGHFQMDNLLAAHDACESIRQAFVRWEASDSNIEELYTLLESEDFLREASASQHEHWLKRNAKKSWVEDAQRLPFDELNVDDQEKNKDIVRTAVTVWVAHRRRGTTGPK